MKKILFIVALVCLLSSALLAQNEDSVYVTFYYEPDGNPTNVWLPGEFNGWTLNNNSKMQKDPATGIWSKAVLLRVGGPNPLPVPGKSIPGAYQYKFNFDGNWIQDPLNPRQNPLDNDNSYLFIRNPTIHYLLPNSVSGSVRTRLPEITAYLYPSKTTSIDTSSIMIKIDSVEVTGIGAAYDSAQKKLSYVWPYDLTDGSHELILWAQSSSGTIGSDTTTFTVQADIAQIFTRNAATVKDNWPIEGAFFKPDGGYDSTVTTAEIFRNDSSWNVSVLNGIVDTTMSLLEGNNIFKIKANVAGLPQVSDTLNIIRKVNHNPFARIDIEQNGSLIEISAANSTDPDTQALTYKWFEDPDNPEILGIDGQTGSDLSCAAPVTGGEYYIELFVEDPDGNPDSTRTFFVIREDTAAIKVAGYADNPQWLKNGRMYLLFFKGFTPEGTIKAAIPNLEYIKAMGFNVIWLLPIFEIPGDVDNQINIGYYIEDFLSIEQSLGTEQDFRDFMDAAHALDLKVVVDITPNHTGNVHPFAIQATTYGDWSPYWNYYQTTFIQHNNNGLGDCVTPEGIYYYCAFSDVLLNYNWDDPDAREYFIDILEYWVSEFDIDGYRFDVYWGPHRKFGEAKFGIPIRNALKHIKPDILLLGETEGTGSGSEVHYADQGGGLDMAYDWNLYWGGIKNFSFTSGDVNNLHGSLANNGYYPGENSYFLRFMENQDEDRISYVYNSFIKTKPVASAIFMAPGIPLMHYGQEVGFGKGMGQPGEPDLNDRRRGIIDWNFDGKDILQPHYQKLAQIRAQFPAFRQHRMDTNGDGQVNSSDESDFIRVTTGDGMVYGYLRPYADENGMLVTNFSNSQKTVAINLLSAGLKFDGDINTGEYYWVNNLYSDTSYQVLGSDLATFQLNLDGFGTAVYVIGTEEKQVNLPLIPPIITDIEDTEKVISGFYLGPNFPNPFNPTTTFRYNIPYASQVKFEIFNIMGQKITTLIDAPSNSGTYQVQWDSRDQHGRQVATGVYIYRFSAGNFVKTGKMILMK